MTSSARPFVRLSARSLARSFVPPRIPTLGRRCVMGAMVLAVVGCSTPPGGGGRDGGAQAAGGSAMDSGADPGAGASAALRRGSDGLPLKNSAECEAAGLKPSAAMPASAIDPAVLNQGRSGWVAVRYDVHRGQPRNVRVVDSQPAGLYDRFAVRHALAYRDPGKGSARDCLMTVQIRF